MSVPNYVQHWSTVTIGLITNWRSCVSPLTQNTTTEHTIGIVLPDANQVLHLLMETGLIGPNALKLKMEDDLEHVIILHHKTVD